jgi:hypothetical protein
MNRSSAGTRVLRDLAASHGIRDVRYASPGRLVGRVSDDRDLLDVAEFDAAASELLHASVMLFSDRVLAHPRVSEDLRTARPV